MAVSFTNSIMCRSFHLYRPKPFPASSSASQNEMSKNKEHLPLKRLFKHHYILMPERLKHPYLSISCLLNNLILICGFLELLNGDYKYLNIDKRMNYLPFSPLSLFFAL